MKIDLIVTRHPALVEYLQDIGLADKTVQVLDHAIAADVRGKIICGVLPHSLSCLASTFVEVPIRVPAELRGQELTLAQIYQYAGEPVAYIVRSFEF